MKVLEKRFVKTIARLMVFTFIVGGINLACTSITLANGGDGAAKNIIIMVCDGCGYNHIDAASYYQYGHAGMQVFEHFPISISMSTYSAGEGYDPEMAWTDFDYVKGDPIMGGATDSAAAATAMSTGFKTYDAAIGGVGDGTELGFTPKKHILERAEELDKSTGVVTSVQISHATPAGFVAHNWDRNNYEEIAYEMIHYSAVDVIMGCGHPDYAPPCSPPMPCPDPYQYVGGFDTWEALVGTSPPGGDADGDGDPDPWTLIQDRTQFQDLATDPNPPERVIGVVANVYNTLQQERGGDSNADPYVVPLTETVPTLEEMTKAALNVLDNNAEGFLMMVEGGATDAASHTGQSGRLIEELIDFIHSVEAVVDWVNNNSNWGETLLIVTGDHETGYLLGPGSGLTLTWEPIVNNGAGVLPGMEWCNWFEPPSPPPPPLGISSMLPPPLPMTWHTNSLVPFYAKGDVARFFNESADEYDPVRGDYLDNTAIAEVIFSIMDLD